MFFRKRYESYNTLPSKGTREYIINLRAELSLYRELTKVVRSCVKAYKREQERNDWRGCTQDYMRPVFDKYNSFERQMNQLGKDV